MSNQTTEGIAFALGDGVMCTWEGTRSDIAAISALPVAGGNLYVIKWPDGGELCVPASGMLKIRDATHAAAPAHAMTAEQLAYRLDCLSRGVDTKRCTEDVARHIRALESKQSPEPPGDVVPRSRYDAANKDWLDEKAAREALSVKSVAWIETLLAALRKIVNEGDFTAPEGMKQIAREALKYVPPGAPSTTKVGGP